MSHIFISYSRTDIACVETVERQLQVAGFTVWRDVAEIRGGDLWKQRIQHAIGEAGAFLLIWSTNTNSSQWVQWELELARESEGLQIIPISIDGTQPPPEITQDTHYVELLGCREQDAAQLLKHIPESLRWQLTEFDPYKSLREQGATSATLPYPAPESIVALEIVRAQRARAYVVGAPDAKLSERKTIQVALHFTRKIREPFLSKIQATLEGEYEDNIYPDTLFAIYVTGYYDEIGEDYRLDDGNPAQWMETANTAYKAVNHVLGALEPQPILQVFGALPASLAFHIGRKFDKYYRMQIYNFLLPPRNEAPYYKLVLDSPPLR